MPTFLESKLKAAYGADSDVPYRVMNSIGAMRGNKVTAKGKAMQAKHERDVQSHAYNHRSRNNLKRGKG